MNLVGVTDVTFDGQSASFSEATSDTLTAVAPSGTATGPVDVTVTTVNGSATKASGFTYVGVPMITAVVPNSGLPAGGTSVSILGLNLLGVTSVTFGGAPASFTVVRSGEISVVTPPGQGVIDIQLVTNVGTANFGRGFTYTSTASATPTATPSASPTATPSPTATGAVCLNPPVPPVVTISNVSSQGADLTWSASPGATRYDFHVNRLISGTWTAWEPWAYYDQPTRVRVLSNGASAFNFSVGAVNACGFSYDPQGCNPTGYRGQCDYAARTVFLGKPSAPTLVSATYANGMFSVTWLAPTDTGNGQSLQYDVTATPGGPVCRTTMTSCITSLALSPGTAVTFTVVASNAAGLSSASVPSNPALVASTKIPTSTSGSGSTGPSSTQDVLAKVPGVPTKVQPRVGNSGVILSWKPSKKGAGAALYVVQTTPKSKGCETPKRRCVLTDLEPGTTYTITVVASNANGSSDESTEVTVRIPLPPPPTPPQQPEPKPVPSYRSAEQ